MLLYTIVQAINGIFGTCSKNCIAIIDIVIKITAKQTINVEP